MITIPQMRFTQVRARALILPPRRFDMGARALLMTNRFCIPMGARYARPSVSPWMNTDSKSTDIPYRPSKAPGIARCTTLLMIAHGGRLRAGVGASGCGMRRWRE